MYFCFRGVCFRASCSSVPRILVHFANINDREHCVQAQSQPDPPSGNVSLLCQDASTIPDLQSHHQEPSGSSVTSQSVFVNQPIVFLKRDNVNVHRAAANIIVSKSRAARGSVCNVLLSRGWQFAGFLAAATRPVAIRVSSQVGLSPA